MHLYSIYLPVCLSNHECTLTTSVLIQHLRVYSDYHPFHICNPLWHWETWFLLALLYLLIWSASPVCNQSFLSTALFYVGAFFPWAGSAVHVRLSLHGHTLTLLRIGLSTLDWPLWDAVFTWYQVGSDSHASSTFSPTPLPPCPPSATSRVGIQWFQFSCEWEKEDRSEAKRRLIQERHFFFDQVPILRVRLKIWKRQK